MYQKQIKEDLSRISLSLPEGTVPLLVAAAVLAVCFEAIAVNLHSALFTAFDSAAGTWLRSLQNELWTAVMKGISLFGSTFILAALCIIGCLLLLSRKKNTSALTLFLSLLGAWLINSLLKSIFKQARPAVEHLVSADGYSFPSGNAMIAIAFYGFICFLLLKNLHKSPIKKALIIAPFTFIILSTGISRVYLGVHEPTDILGGYASGGSWLILCILLNRIMEHRSSKSHHNPAA